jgi:hypothetical protein
MKIKHIVSLILILSFAILLTSCTEKTEESEFIRLLKFSWSVDLPNDFELLYTENGQDSFIRYAVLKFNEEPNDFMNKLEFNTDENSNFIDSFELLLNQVNDYDIPDEFLPDWQNEYTWIHLVTRSSNSKTPTINYSEDLGDISAWDHMYMIYDIESYTLIILRQNF